jgi:hypothetical protein
MEKIKIIGDSLNANELYELLNPEIASGKDLNLVVEKTPKNSMSLMPEVLMAVIAFSQVTLSALITGIFTILQRRVERNTAKQNAYIEVKIEDESVTLKAPVGATDEEIQRIVDLSKKAVNRGKKISQIQLIEKT